MGSAPRLARIIFLARMVGFTSACQCPYGGGVSDSQRSCGSWPGCTSSVVMVSQSGCGFLWWYACYACCYSYYPPPPPPSPPSPPPVDWYICSNTCSYPGDGECDDGGPGSEFSDCDIGTDCVDCGPRINRLERCSSGCGACTNGPITNFPGSPEYFYKTTSYFTCPACSGVASGGGRMYIYQAYLHLSTTNSALALYLWFNCSNGRWTRSRAYGGGGNTTCPNRFSCPGPYNDPSSVFAGSTLYPISMWSSCPIPITSVQDCYASSPPPPPPSFTSRRRPSSTGTSARGQRELGRLELLLVF